MYDMTVTNILHLLPKFALSHICRHCIYIHTYIHVYINVTDMPMHLYMCIYQQQLCLLNATYANYFMCRWATNINIHVSFEMTAIKCANRSPGKHTLDIIGISSWTSIPYLPQYTYTLTTLLLLHPTLLNISVRKQCTASCTYHTIGIYVQATCIWNTKCANDLTCINEEVSQYIYTTYEVTDIKHLTRSTVHIKWWWEQQRQCWKQWQWQHCLIA